MASICTSLKDSIHPASHDSHPTTFSKTHHIPAQHLVSIRNNGTLSNRSTNGYGTITFKTGTYTGAIQAGKMHGFGTLVYSDQTRYEGEWYNGKYHGQGVKVFKDGIYNGTFNMGKRQGKGTMKYLNGDKYVGEYEGDVYSGLGKKKFANGAFYNGEFKLGLFHGKGKLVYNNGVKIKCEWRFGNEVLEEM